MVCEAYPFVLDRSSSESLLISACQFSAFRNRSILPPIIGVFDDFILEGDKTLLMLPPVRGGVIARGHWLHEHSDMALFQRLAEEPADAAGVENVGWDDDA